MLKTWFDLQMESVALWDKARTTRSFLQFDPPGAVQDALKVEDVVDFERVALATLATVEAISSDVVRSIAQIFQRVIKGGGACHRSGGITS